MKYELRAEDLKVLSKSVEELEPLDIFALRRIRKYAERVLDKELLKVCKEKETEFLKDASPVPEWLEERWKEYERISLEEAERRLRRALETLRKHGVRLPNPIMKTTLKMLLYQTY